MAIDIAEVISNEDFNALLNKHVEVLIKQYEENSYEYIEPDLFIFEIQDEDSTEYPLTILAIRSEEFNTKRYELMEKLGQSAAIDMLMPAAIFIVSEAWAKAFTSEQNKNRKGKKVSEFDDKKEIALIAGMTIDGRTNSVVMDIKRVGKNIKVSNPAITLYDPESPHVGSDLLSAFIRGYLKQVVASRDARN